MADLQFPPINGINYHCKWL
ncbi:hypothetical protein CCACVL1_05562 [Corchorus capsularis]|uniref:Uncharacterized protein n=1 Tax=Corchorus capsularis TaxID=210143 RepID=A0A1R3JJU6_COCAP|nr:hypothetical protein CCACVL1_05562 [Corchorus capsularis]